MLYLSNIFIFDAVKLSDYLFFSLILITSVLSCERSEPPECNCGVVLETTTGTDGTNPFATNCDGVYNNFDNYTIRVRNNCTNNIKRFCNHNPWYEMPGSEWCDYNSTEAW